MSKHTFNYPLIMTHYNESGFLCFELDLFNISFLWPRNVVMSICVVINMNLMYALIPYISVNYKRSLCRGLRISPAYLCGSQHSKFFPILPEVTRSIVFTNNCNCHTLLCFNIPMHCTLLLLFFILTWLRRHF